MSQTPRRLSRKELLRRNKRIMKRRRNRMIMAAVAVTAFLVYVTGLYGASLAYLGDFLSSSLVYLQVGDGFPVEIENHTFRQAEKMGSALCVLDSERLTFLSPTGDKVYEYYHSMQSPVMSASDNRAVVYSSNQTSLKVANAHKILFSIEMDNDIIHSYMAKNNYVAVTTKSQAYNGEVTVFNSQMEKVFIWYSAKSFPMQSFLSPKAKTLAVSCLLTEDGILKSELYIIDAKEGTEKFTVKQENTVPLAVEFIKEESILVFYTDKAVLIDIETGEQKAALSYDGKDLASYDIKNSQILLSLGNYNARENSNLVILDLNLNKVKEIQAQQYVTDVEIISQRIFALGLSGIEQYTLEGGYVTLSDVRSDVRCLVDYNGCVVVYTDCLEMQEKVKTG